MTLTYRADVVIAGGGLAGLATALESLDHGLSVLILDRDSNELLGGLAKRSFGGVMFVDTPHQRKLGIKDTPDQAWSDWQAFADFGAADDWPRRWARTYVERSRDLIFDWLTSRGIEFLPVVNWAERGLFRPGNSVPRWHIAWGTGFAIIEAVIASLNNHPGRNRLEVHCNRRVDHLLVEGGRVVGCAGHREDEGDAFEARSDHVVLASGGICGGDLSKVKANWYKPWGGGAPRRGGGSRRGAGGGGAVVAARPGAARARRDRPWA
ncbi:MAG: FAD-dependent oxidoreductase, partial [Acidobacteriota bacterium]|nr:FAD-dependent oxidoreductase [Acidobacteriota bacterium]